MSRFRARKARVAALGGTVAVVGGSRIPLPDLDPAGSAGPLREAVIGGRRLDRRRLGGARARVGAGWAWGARYWASLDSLAVGRLSRRLGSRLGSLRAALRPGHAAWPASGREPLLQPSHDGSYDPALPRPSRNPCCAGNLAIEGESGRGAPDPRPAQLAPTWTGAELRRSLPHRRRQAGLRLARRLARSRPALGGSRGLTQPWLPFWQPSQPWLPAFAFTALVALAAAFAFAALSPSAAFALAAALQPGGSPSP